MFSKSCLATAIVSQAFLICLVIAKRCSNIPPKLELMNRGIDITKLVLLPLNHDEDTGFARKVVDFSCDGQTRWTSPYNKALTYELPDQIEKINTIPGGILDAVFSYHQNMEDVKKSLATDAGFNAKYESGMFTSSATYRYYQTAITQKSQKVSEVEASFFGFQVDLKPFWKLNISHTVSLYVKKILPNNFKDDPTKFFDFFKYFGTHFISRAKFGGKFRMTFMMKSSLLNKLSTSEIEASAKSSFFYALDTNKNFSTDITQIQKQFNNEAHMSARFYGGNVNLMDTNDISSWWESVPDNPWLFNCELEPITNLIPEGSKKQALLEAYKAYLDKAYLSEIKQTLFSLIKSHKYGDQKAFQLMKTVNELKSETVANHSAVRNLGKEVNDYFFAPNWFLTQTKLCYTSKPFESSNSCPTKQICAKPNNKVSEFKYDTDFSSSNCYLSWGLKSTFAEEWFTNVQICASSRRRLRWLPLTLSLENRCASIGQFTEDSTKIRPTKLYVIDSRKWKLSVPKNSPAWLMNTQICVHASIDKYGGYCGDGFNRTICASANEWTKSSRLLTDNNNCIFSWSLRTD